MPDPKHPDPLPFVLYGTNDAVIANPVSPEANFLSPQSLSESMRIVLTRETLAQIAEDSSLDLVVETRQFFEGGRIKLNAPGQAAAPLPR
jgi:hypothetical protein